MRRGSLEDPCAVHHSHAALGLTGPEPNLLSSEAMAGAQSSPLRPERLTCAQSDPTRADHGPGAEAQPAVAKRRARPEGSTTVAVSPYASAEGHAPIGRRCAIGQPL